MARTILVVDDDIDVIESITIPLEANDYRVVSTTDPKEALPLIARERPDLIFLDVMFPGNSTAGFELCRDIKADPVHAGIPVILVSAINQQFNMNFTSGKETQGWVPADLFIEKPLDIEQMLGIVRRFDETGSVAPPA